MLTQMLPSVSKAGPSVIRCVGGAEAHTSHEEPDEAVVEGESLFGG